MELDRFEFEKKFIEEYIPIRIKDGMHEQRDIFELYYIYLCLSNHISVLHNSDGVVDAAKDFKQIYDEKIINKIEFGSNTVGIPLVNLIKMADDLRKLGNGLINLLQDPDYDE
jgi:hypothetical protein